MTATTEGACEYGLFPIATKTLCDGSPPDVEIFLKGGKGARPTLFHKRGTPLDQPALERLLDNGVRTLYVSSAEIDQYNDYLLAEVMANEDRPPLERFELLRDASQSVVLNAMVSGHAESVLQVTGEFAERLVDVIWDRQVVLMDLFGVMAHDYTTFTHASNVSTYCLILAEALGIRSAQQLVSIAQGGLLHDLGKRHVPKKILNKKSQLSETEWREMQKHPTLGFQELCGQDDVDLGQLMMVYQHHERWDGKGYPVGIPAEETHLWARICAVVDAFDALTTDRPYRRGYVAENAINYLDMQAGKSFDPEIVRCWIAILKENS